MNKERPPQEPTNRNVLTTPDMETHAAQFLAAGIRVLAVYTGESDNAGRYVMRACSALQIGNEPEFAFPATSQPGRAAPKTTW